MRVSNPWAVAGGDAGRDGRGVRRVGAAGGGAARGARAQLHGAPAPGAAGGARLRRRESLCIVPDTSGARQCTTYVTCLYAIFFTSSSLRDHFSMKQGWHWILSANRISMAIERAQNIIL